MKNLLKNQGKITFLNFVIYAMGIALPLIYFFHHQWGSRANIPLALYMIGSQLLIAATTHISVGYWPAKDFGGFTRDDEKKRAIIGYLILPIAAHAASIGLLYWGYTEW